MATQSQTDPMMSQTESAATNTNNSSAANEERQDQRRNSDLLDQIVASGKLAEERDRLIVARADLDYKQRLAKMFANSGCFVNIDKDQDGKFLPETMSIARAVVKIELGASMGFSPAESMTGIDIIKGRVAVGANLRAARMQRAGYGWPQMICRDEGCWIPLEFQGKPMLQQKVSEDGELVFDSSGKPVMVQVVVSFTKKDADRAGLSGKDNYKKDPSSMYFARAITRTQRRYGPGVLGVDVLDTYEAQDLGPGADRALFSIDALRPSSDENRGHDATEPQHAGESSGDVGDKSTTERLEKPKGPRKSGAAPAATDPSPAKVAPSSAADNSPETSPGPKELF